MSWYENMIDPLRILINDYDSTSYKYSDETLQKLLVTSANFVSQEIKLVNLYDISFDPLEISPDPSEDTLFINFVVMKAACLTNQWTFNSKLLSQGIKTKLGPVTMETDTAGASVMTALLKDGFCGAYSEMKKQHNYGNTKIVKSILTPFTNTDNYYGGYNSRSKYI